MASDKWTGPATGGQPDIPLAVLENLRIVCHSMPDVDMKPHVVGLNAIPMDHAGPGALGYLISDFLAWKLLFHGEGERSAQAWFSMVDIGQAMSAHHTEYSHGISSRANESSTSKNVTLANKSIQVETDAHALFGAFSDELAKQAEAAAAAKNKECLIIILCCEMSPEGNVCLDLAEKKKYLSKQTFLTGLATRFDIPITLIAPSLFSSGWEITPFAGQGRKPSGMPASLVNNILAKQCGGAFAGRMIKELTDSAAAYPIFGRKSAEEAEHISHFYTEIHDTLIRRTSSDLRDHSLSFKENEDEWEVDMGKRKGVKLQYWAKKWEKCEQSVPMSDVAGYPFLGGAFGGNRGSQLTHIRFLAHQELKSAPGDWDQPGTDYARKFLTGFLQTGTSQVEEDLVREVFTFIEWRCSCNFLADIIIDHVGLPRPQGKSCRYWNWETHQNMEKEGDEMLAKLRLRVFGHLAYSWPKNTLPFGRQHNPHCELRYWRPLLFVSAAVSLKLCQGSAATGDAEPFVDRHIRPFLNKMKDIQMSLLRENVALMALGDRWRVATRSNLAEAQAKPTSQSSETGYQAPKLEDEGKSSAIAPSESVTPTSLLETLQAMMKSMAPADRKALLGAMAQLDTQNDESATNTLKHPPHSTDIAGTQAPLAAKYELATGHSSSARDGEPRRPPSAIEDVDSLRSSLPSALTQRQTLAQAPAQASSQAFAHASAQAPTMNQWGEVSWEEEQKKKEQKQAKMLKKVVW